MKDFLEKINASNVKAEDRIDALKSLVAAINEDDFPPFSGENNNHVHTIYSFSPYTPTMAALIAKKSGLDATGSVDHDSISAATEMKTACEILKLGCTTGFEVRTSFKNTPFESKRLNSPESIGVAYITVQGIPSGAISKVRDFLLPIHEARNERNRSMIEKLNQLLATEYAGEVVDAISYEDDVLPLSKANEGGSITERHILCAFAISLARKYPSLDKLLFVLKERLKIAIPAQIEKLLMDSMNPHFIYDLIGLLKLEFLQRFFIQPSEWECLPVDVVVNFAHSIGAIPCYVYFGDVKDATVGGANPNPFEDDFLEDLLLVLKEFGFLAVAYDPSRNSKHQLIRLQRFCKKYEFLQILGTSIASSRESFALSELKLPEYQHLSDTTRALLAHEKLSSVNQDFGLFAMNNPTITMTLEKRLKIYTDFGKRLVPLGSLTIDKASAQLAQGIID
ncbi:MAG: PHP domain-containing protein [Treponemataceae bacterium]